MVGVRPADSVERVPGRDLPNAGRCQTPLRKSESVESRLRIRLHNPAVLVEPFRIVNPTASLTQERKTYSILSRSHRPQDRCNPAACQEDAFASANFFGSASNTRLHPAQQK